MGYNRVSVSQCVCHKVVVRYLKKGIHGSRLILLARRPCTDLTKSGENRSIRFDKEVGTALSCPIRELIPTCIYFVANLFDTEHVSRRVLRNQPLPEGRAEIEAVVGGSSPE